MSWSALTDMELDDEDKLDAILPMPMEKPDYPPGLRICLTEKELEKLCLEDDCEIGDMIDLRCFAIVTSISKTDPGCCRIELQITHMAAENEMTEDEDDEADEMAEPQRPRRSLYDRGNNDAD